MPMPQSSALSFGSTPRRRKPSLTPMIDVVFLLLVFFMLAARFGVDNAIPLAPALSGGGEYRGAPRLVTVAPEGVRLNGVALAPENLVGALRQLMPEDDSIVVLRAVDGADLQGLVAVLDRLGAAGMTRIVLAE